jgi:hypothetical protein
MYGFMVKIYGDRNKYIYCINIFKSFIAYLMR